MGYKKYLKSICTTWNERDKDFIKYGFKYGFSLGLVVASAILANGFQIINKK